MMFKYVQYLWTVTAIKTRLPPAATWSTTDDLQFYNVHQFGCFGHAQQNDWRYPAYPKDLPAQRRFLPLEVAPEQDFFLGPSLGQPISLESPVSTIVLELIINGFVWKKSVCVTWIQWLIIMIPVFCIAIIGNRFHVQTHTYIYIYVCMYVYIYIYHPSTVLISPRSRKF